MTKLGVYAITAQDVTGEKYSQLRSFYLNGKLLEETGLENAYAVTYKDMYFLAVNGVCYVLDGLQASQTDRSAPYATRQYAGFYLTNIPARVLWTDGDMVRSVENYATQTAKAEVSDYEPDSWVQKVQAQAGTSTGDIYTLLLARQLIYAAEGQKDANGKTISGTKKAAAIRNLENAGYSQAYAQELYKLFG